MTIRNDAQILNMLQKYGVTEGSEFTSNDTFYVDSGSAGAQVNAANAGTVALMCVSPAFLLPGGIDFNAANNTPTSGIADVYLVYRPLTEGAIVTAA